MTQPLQINLKGLPYAPAECVVEQQQIESVQQVVQHVANNYDQTSVVPAFCQTYLQWIYSSKLNCINGLEKFPNADYSLGTSESFDKFYLRHHNRRFRCFRGEYLYHTLAWNSQHMPWAYLDDEPIAENDAVVISVPFADLGNLHPAYDNNLLDRCYELGVPVLIDCAFFGVCGGIVTDFDHPAITDLCFSLSKTFPVNTVRIGMRLTRSSVRDTMSIYNSTQYVNRFGAAVAIELLKFRSADDTYQMWRSRQLQFCKEMNLVPSDTVIFGIDFDHQYDNYNRGMPHSNRLCFSRNFEQGIL